MSYINTRKGSINAVWGEPHLEYCVQLWSLMFKGHWIGRSAEDI